MLGQIELSQSAPTINVLWKISSALGVPFSALNTTKGTIGPHVLRAEQAKLLRSADGTFSSRALFPFDEPRRVEFYELRLAPGGVERADALHRPPASCQSASAPPSTPPRADAVVVELGPAVTSAAGKESRCSANPPVGMQVIGADLWSNRWGPPQSSVRLFLPDRMSEISRHFVPIAANVREFVSPVVFK